MRLALYCPDYGFYEKEEDTIGRNGDFYTSVSVGNLFGELLSFQFAEWLLECQSETCPVQIVEAGAHRGHLARDILTWFRDHRPERFDSLQYAIVEPSSVRQKWQTATLAEFEGKVVWHSYLTHRASRVSGIIFANELLDAMPVRRFSWDAERKTWFEWGVTLKNGELGWARLDSKVSPPIPTSEHLLAVLPDGFTFEWSEEAEKWWHDAALALERGRLMTIDYGMTAEELFSPERTDGTLRGYYRHHQTSDLLANPGKQDLTAHVNFSALIAAGEAIGLKTEILETQAHFLTQIVSRGQKNGLCGQWSASHARQFQTLTHPEHLGRSFRVLVQQRDSTGEVKPGHASGGELNS